MIKHFSSTLYSSIMFLVDILERRPEAYTTRLVYNSYIKSIIQRMYKGSM